MTEQQARELHELMETFKVRREHNQWISDRTVYVNVRAEDLLSVLQLAASIARDLEIIPQ